MQKNIGKQWMEAGFIIPLLDGLDELASNRQETCVERNQRIFAVTMAIFVSGL